MAALGANQPRNTAMQALMQALESGARIVTANPRLAVWMRRRYDAAQRAQGATAWAAAAIVSYDDWLQELWQAKLLWGDPPPHATLLSPLQEQYLWERILQAHSGARPSLDLSATARAAQEAWTWLHAWRLDLAAAQWAASPDGEEFRVWAVEYARFCRDQDWLSPAQLADALVPGNDATPLRLAGFDTVTPQQQALLDRLGAVPLRLDAIGTGEARAAAFALPALEWRAAARWARERVEAGAAGIAVVAPDLGACRALAERVFLEELHPGRAAWDTTPRAFEIALGPALGEYPLVAAALDLLELAATPEALEWTTVSRLLRSPYLPGAEAGRAARAQIEFRLRSRETTHLTLRQLAAEAAEFAPLVPALPPRRPDSTALWAASFASLLDSVGWPGTPALNSTEHQARDAWRNLLTDLASLATVGARETFPQAVARLRRLAAARIFQPRTAPAPIQVLGWLETAGMRFDAIWVVGLDDTSAPPPPRPNPFLPWRLQVEANLPRNSAARERNLAQRRLDALLRAAPEAHISYATHDAEGTPCLPSPLAPALRRLKPVPTTAGPTAAGVELETADDTAVPLSPLRAAAETYTSGLFSDQAACPFRAFAHQRLRATLPPQAAWGLSPPQRGNLAHAALRAAWATICSSQRLRELHASGELEAVLDAAVRAALAGEPAFAAWPWLRGPEEMRLHRLLRDWFQVERTRPADFNVELQELPVTPQFGGLTLHLRLDRIDVLENGEHVIVDYKTGSPGIPDWEDATLQPQLPLYAATAPPQPVLAAVAIAALPEDTAEKLKLEYFACAAHDAIFTETARSARHAKIRIPDDYPATLAAWRRQLEELAAEFLAGRADVAPRHGLKTCEYCDLMPLCRIHESLQAEAGDDEDTDVAGDA